MPMRATLVAASLTSAFGLTAKCSTVRGGYGQAGCCASNPESTVLANELFDFQVTSAPDNSERLLKREGVIYDLPTKKCQSGGKNVILVVGDGMGWEMIRAGAIAKRVVDELKSHGVDIHLGAPNATLAAAAKAAFAGRTTSHYYTYGKGSGLSFQNLQDYALMTTTTVITQVPNKGDHYGPARSMLKGSVSSHDNGMAELATDAHGAPLQFDPRDFEATNGSGFMVLWDDVKGGTFPWDANYYGQTPLSPGFDPRFIQRHATDSASTAGSMATGVKAAVNMQSVDLYEREASTLVEDAMYCNKAAGVVSSVPILHATPGAFVTHSNYRKNGPQMQTTLKKMNPTLLMGWCASRYQPSETHKTEMKAGVHGKWTVLEQDLATSGDDLLGAMDSLDPDSGDHVLACFGGGYTPSGQYNAPYRGIDSSYNGTWRTSKTAVKDENGATIAFTPTTSYGNHYSAEELHSIPKMATIVKKAVEFLGKDDDGFFLMYEQGDIDWAAHDNHMDNMLGTMLDIHDGVDEIITWIQANGGWEKNALYVTADHDHYLTLKPNFPQRLAELIIDGRSHDITPNATIGSGYVSASMADAPDPSRANIEHKPSVTLSQLSTWADGDIGESGHFWGVESDGGNAWDSHTMRPVPVSYQGDTDNCVASLKGRGYNVLGKQVAGSPGKIDQVHLHACMLKALMGY